MNSTDGGDATPLATLILWGFIKPTSTVPVFQRPRSPAGTFPHLQPGCPTPAGHQPQPPSIPQISRKRHERLAAEMAALSPAAQRAREAGHCCTTSLPTCQVQKDFFKKNKIKKKKPSIRSWLKNNKSVVKCG